MKKFYFLLIFVFLFCATARAASEDGKTTKGPMARVGTVMVRGLAGVVGLPIEIPRTTVKEIRLHHKIWPITFVPRTAQSIIIRTTSAFNDFVFFPVIVPFTDDISPWTEAFDLPEYPWQKQ